MNHMYACMYKGMCECLRPAELAISSSVTAGLAIYLTAIWNSRIALGGFWVRLG